MYKKCLYMIVFVIAMDFSAKFKNLTLRRIAGDIRRYV